MIVPATTVVRQRAGNGGWEMATRDPLPELAPYVRRYCGFDEAIGRPLRRREMPSAEVTLVFSFGPDLGVVMQPADPAPHESWHGSFVAGLHDSYVVTHHEGESRGVELNLTPLGARALLGVPAGTLARQVVDLDAVLGADAAMLSERLHEAGDWDARFALLDAYLRARVAGARQPSPVIAWAWRRMNEAGGAVSIGALAAEAGCSHRHFIARFREEIGLAPKTMARIMRFDRAYGLLDGDEPDGLAQIAFTCGYYDQAHLSRDFRAFTGSSPRELVARRSPDGAGVSAH